ncbi:hypothetical protein DFJ63DRAFT_312913 [Scheffersomyces coipomensis]|uniref:uncharacterized protein n=1 Tax=Scheffersomyces coipomensis TaxID=1788519 RepID=UPI00315DF481
MRSNYLSLLVHATINSSSFTSTYFTTNHEETNMNLHFPFVPVSTSFFIDEITLNQTWLEIKAIAYLCLPLFFFCSSAFALVCSCSGIFPSQNGVLIIDFF